MNDFMDLLAKYGPGGPDTPRAAGPGLDAPLAPSLSEKLAPAARSAAMTGAALLAAKYAPGLARRMQRPPGGGRVKFNIPEPSLSERPTVKYSPSEMKAAEKNMYAEAGARNKARPEPRQPPPDDTPTIPDIDITTVETGPPGARTPTYEQKADEALAYQQMVKDWDAEAAKDPLMLLLEQRLGRGKDKARNEAAADLVRRLPLEERADRLNQLQMRRQSLKEGRQTIKNEGLPPEEAWAAYREAYEGVPPAPLRERRNPGTLKMEDDLAAEQALSDQQILDEARQDLGGWDKITPEDDQVLEGVSTQMLRDAEARARLALARSVGGR